MDLKYSNPRMKATIENWPSGRHRVTAHFEIEQDPKRVPGLPVSPWMVGDSRGLKRDSVSCAISHENRQRRCWNARRGSTMAKCVRCKAINAENESEVHPNWFTIDTAQRLERIADRTPKSATLRFCGLHGGKDENGTETGRGSSRVNFELQQRADRIKRRRKEELARTIREASQLSLAQIVRTLVGQ